MSDKDHLTAAAVLMSLISGQPLQKNLNIKPILEIRPGCRFNVIATKDLVLQKPYAASR
jgi:type IV secretion system protein VirB10